jgi:dTDP-4-dehydrorhamnose reductase
MKRILITGGGGMLASEIELFHLNMGVEVKSLDHCSLDVLDRYAVEKAIAEFRPEVVFHTAALHVEACEEDPELAFKLNAWASGVIARNCEKVGAKLIYISSCGFFGDDIKYNSEYDQVVLKTVYARSKYCGEKETLDGSSMTYVIRPGWLFGGSIKHKKNFVYQRYLEAIKSQVIRTAGDKYGSPTFTGDLVQKMDEILEAGSPGLYHVTNAGGCTRADYVGKIVKSCGLKTAVEPVDSSHFPRKANVPNCEMLSNWNMKYLGISPMLPWEEAIERYTRKMLKEIRG